MLISDILCSTSSVLNKCVFVCMVGIFHCYTSVIHDLHLLDLHFITLITGIFGAMEGKWGICSSFGNKRKAVNLGKKETMFIYMP